MKNGMGKNFSSWSLATLLFYLQFSIHGAADDLCNRIYFKHGLENDVPYIVEGVYKRTSSIGDGFPVFKHEQKNLYFQFSKRPRQLYFSNDGLGRSKYFGVSAAVLSTFSLSSITDRKYPFRASVVYWQRYKPSVKRHKTLASGAIDAFCISDDIYECSSGRSYFNRSLSDRQTGVTLHNRRTDYFFQIPGSIRSNRPRYRHSRQIAWVLYYSGGRWILSVNGAEALSIKDSSLRPEFIMSNEWKTPDNRVIPGRFYCKGSNILGRRCRDFNPCLNRAKCTENDIDEIVCRCTPGYIGLYCHSNLPMCPSGTGADFSSRYPGDLATVFCAANQVPEFYFSYCKQGSSSASWYTNGKCIAEGKPTIYAPGWSGRKWTTYRPTPGWSGGDNKGMSAFTKSYENVSKAKQVNFDEYSWLVGFAIFLACFLQLLHFCGIPWVQMRCNKKGDFNLLRYYSFHAFISIVLWSIYLITCKAVDCSKNGKAFGAVSYIGYSVIVLAYVFIFLESFFCTEYRYLQSMLGRESILDYLTRLKDTKPVRMMKLSCYHYELRTKSVNYTDATGRTENQLETFQEMVESYSEKKQFDFGYFRDISGSFDKITKGSGIAKVKLSKEVVFGDQITQQEFERRKEEFKNMNAHRDEYPNVSCEDDLYGFKEHVCAPCSVDTWWTNSFVFFIFVLFGLSWPYRLVLNWTMKEGHYHIRKEIFLHQPFPSIPTSSQSHSILQPQSQMQRLPPATSVVNQPQWSHQNVNQRQPRFPPPVVNHSPPPLVSQLQPAPPRPVIIQPPSTPYVIPQGHPTTITTVITNHPPHGNYPAPPAVIPTHSTPSVVLPPNQLLPTGHTPVLDFAPSHPRSQTPNTAAPNRFLNHAIRRLPRILNIFSESLAEQQFEPQVTELPFQGIDASMELSLDNLSSGDMF